MNEETSSYRCWPGYIVEFTIRNPPVAIGREIRFGGACLDKPKNWLVYP